MMASRAIFMAMVLASLLCAGGCAASVGFLPSDTAAVFANPTQVEAYRLGSLTAHPGYGGKMDGYAVIGTGEVTSEFNGELGKIVADPENYADEIRDHEFVPDVGFRLYRKLDGGRGQMVVDVLISFDSDQVMMVARDNRQREYFRRLLESDRGRLEFLQMTQRAFPADEWARSLTPVRPAATQGD